MATPDRPSADDAIVVLPPRANAAGPQIAFEAFGVRILVTANEPDLIERVKPFLPPGWRPCSGVEVDKRFTVLADAGGTYGIAKDGKGIARGASLELALELLDSQLRIHIGEHSPDAIFVHAGVVAHRGRALVLPGVSFAGKTTLVAELVRAGAIYYSDEFALIDDAGLVHPYAKPLSVRGGDLAQTNHEIAAFGGTVGVEPLPVGLIAVTRYRPDATWKPRRLSAGEGVIAMLANTVPAQTRPRESLRALGRAAARARVIESDRGEAGIVVPQLFAELERIAAAA